MAWFSLALFSLFIGSASSQLTTWDNQVSFELGRKASLTDHWQLFNFGWSVSVTNRSKCLLAYLEV